MRFGRLKRWPLGALTGMAVAAAGGAPASAAAPPPALAATLRALVERDGAPGATVIVMKDGKLLYRLDVGAMSPDTRLRVESATKWMTAALVMTVVDEGKLRLDDPIGRRLPEFRGAAGRITLRQLLSFTAGQGALTDLVDVRQPADISLAESAARIAKRPLQDPPGAVFRYGGPSLQVAGALVEQATGKPWAQLFDERLARPLGLSHTSWVTALRSPPPGAVRNPNLQAGLVTTADDYAAFLTMLAQGGVYDGRRILSAAAVEAMETPQTVGKPMAYVPPGAAGKNLQYALGAWCETLRPDGSCGIISSPGMLGTYPWIDRSSGVYGLFFLDRRLPLVADDLRQARRTIIEAEGARPAPPPPHAIPEP